MKNYFVIYETAIENGNITNVTVWRNAHADKEHAVEEIYKTLREEESIVNFTECGPESAEHVVYSCAYGYIDHRVVIRVKEIEIGA